MMLVLLRQTIAFLPPIFVWILGNDYLDLLVDFTVKSFLPRFPPETLHLVVANSSMEISSLGIVDANMFRC